MGDAGNGPLSDGDNRDELYGGGGNDSLAGGSGDDSLYGGGGKDTMAGGDGTDYFILGGAGALGADAVVIKDFDWLDGEKIGLDESVFSPLLFGELDTLVPEAITNGIAANNGVNPQLIYTYSSGQLYYDADGTGIGGKVLIATFDAASKPL